MGTGRAEPNHVAQEKGPRILITSVRRRTTPPFWASLKESRVLRARMHQKQRFDIWASNTRRCCNDSRSPLWISLLLFFFPLKVSPSPSSIFDFFFMQSPHTPARSLVHGHTHPFIRSMWNAALMMAGYRNLRPPPAPRKPHFYRDDESAPKSFSLTHLFFS